MRATSVLLNMAMVAALAVATASGAARSSDESSPVRILDRSLRPMYEMDLGFISEETVEGEGQTAMLEFGGFWQMAYFQNVLESDVDLNLDYDLTIFTDSADVHLPDQLGAFVLDSGATWRFMNGSSFEGRAKPGFYSDLEELDLDALYMPFSGVVRTPFTPVLSGMVGLEIRPGFERIVMPVVGLGWEIAPRLLLKAGVPETRLTYYTAAYITPYVGLDWNDTTYALHEEKPFDREEITVEDWRAFAGVAWHITAEMQLAVELGDVFSRDFEFSHSESTVNRELSVDDAWFLRAAVRGPF